MRHLTLQGRVPGTRVPARRDRLQLHALEPARRGRARPARALDELLAARRAILRSATRRRSPGADAALLRRGGLGALELLADVGPRRRPSGRDGSWIRDRDGIDSRPSSCRCPTLPHLRPPRPARCRWPRALHRAGGINLPSSADLDDAGQDRVIAALLARTAAGRRSRAACSARRGGRVLSTQAAWTARPRAADRRAGRGALGGAAGRCARSITGVVGERRVQPLRVDALVDEGHAGAAPPAAARCCRS